MLVLFLPLPLGLCPDRYRSGAARAVVSGFGETTAEAVVLRLCAVELLKGSRLDGADRS